MKDVTLSVIIISYKQVKYIREAIESVLIQKVNFDYELILADDYSNDGTLEIMKEYAKKHSFIKVLERKKNMGAVRNILDSTHNCVGKYVTILEGDDYWIDKNKLQTQIDFLEKNKDYIGISHLQQGINNYGKIMGIFPKKYKTDITINDVNELLKNKKYSYSSTLYKNIYKDKKHFANVEKLFSLDSTVGDFQICTYLLSLGKIYVINKPLMAYRMRNNDGDSNYNSTHSINEIELTYLKINIFLDEFYNYEYNFYLNIKNNFTLGVAYDICKLKFDDIKNFKKILPKKYKVKIYISFPLTCIKILYNRFIGH